MSDEIRLKEALVSTVKEIIQTALISLGIFLFVYVFLVQPHRVQGISMEPTFDDGELLLTEKLSYKLSRVERGDVVVFEAPVERKVDFIKRVIGLPGENIKIKDGSIYINGLKLEEAYISPVTSGFVDSTLRKDEFFVLGDNRTASSDSRSFGSITRKSFRGKVWLIYWPIIKANRYEGFRFISDINYSIAN